MHSPFRSLILATTLALPFGPALAEEQMVPPSVSFPDELDKGALAAESAIAECRLAETMIGSGEIVPALILMDACIEVLRNVETKAHYVHFRGLTLDRIGVLKRATEDFERAVKLQPKTLEYSLSLGHSWLKREENEKAVSIFRSSLKLSPGNTEALAGLGSSWLALGDLPRASAFVQRALDANPDHIFALRDRGLIFLRNAQGLRAREDFDRALRGAPDLWDLHLYRGIANFRSGRPDEALKDFNTAASLDEDNPRVLVNRGAVLGQTGHIEEAFADFDAALEINPGTAEAWYGRGLLGARIAAQDPAARADMMEQARVDLKQAITLDPGNARLDAAMSILHPEPVKEDKRRF